MRPYHELHRSPGKALTRGYTCSCVSWCQPITPNFRASLRGEEELDHAPLCDGAGEILSPEFFAAIATLDEVLGRQTELRTPPRHLPRGSDGMPIPPPASLLEPAPEIPSDQA